MFERIYGLFWYTDHAGPNLEYNGGMPNYGVGRQVLAAWAACPTNSRLTPVVAVQGHALPAIRLTTTTRTPASRAIAPSIIQNNHIFLEGAGLGYPHEITASALPSRKLSYSGFPVLGSTRASLL